MFCNPRFLMLLWLSCASLYLSVFSVGAQTVSGSLMKWHKVTLTFNGVNTCETATPNPFTDYRLNVTFTNGNKTYVVPGYYAANGVAGNSGGNCGNKWRVHFTPDATGVWSYVVSYRTATNIAISDNAGAGAAVAPLDGTTGSFTISPSNKTGKDFRAKGMLRYVGEHHLQFAETKEYYLKGGANSPENILAYHEFDQTSDLGGTNTPGLTNGLHVFAPHVQDWKQGDPLWMNTKGKGIIGMLNYLAAQDVNSVYFLTYNIDGGDGSDVWMWTSSSERYRFDCSKLDQWEIVFSHMDSLGIHMHLITQERENDQMFGGNSQLNNIRKLYYRELVARFSHHLALQWNIGEENDNTDAQRAAYAQYIRNLDPYQHPIAVHTQSGNAGTFYDGIMSTPAWQQYFEATSIQGEATYYNAWTIQLRNETSAAGKKWAINLDEQIPPVKPDLSNIDELRKNALWGNLMGGGGGMEWYFGYNGNFGDVQSEDMRIVEPLWQQTKYAIDFFQAHLPFEEMEPKNALLSGMGNHCLAKEGDTYAVYLKNGSVSPVALSITKVGDYSVKWFHPKTGGTLKTGSVPSIHVLHPGNYHIGQAPYAAEDDWVVLVEATSESATICEGDSILIGGAYRKSTGVYQEGNVTTYLTVEDCDNPCLLEVQKMTLVFEGMSGSIGELTDGMVINKDTLCRFNIRADACLDMVKSVKFRMNGIIFRTESTPPFALAGDNPAGNYNVWTPNTGVHTVSVTPYTGLGGTGTAGPEYTITFTIVDTDLNDNTACAAPPVMDCNGNINGTAAFDTCGICAGGLTGITPNACEQPCNDNNLCTNDARVNGVCTFTPVICTDHNSCTSDACVNGQCVFTPRTCNDNNACTTDNCANGQCVYVPLICNDNNACTTDACANGQCVFTPLSCNDNNACTTDHCVNGQCVFTPLVCNDNNSCTADACVNGQCVFTPTANCNDNNACTTDNCANGQCVFTPLICNDNNSCTADACVNGQCVFTPTANCNDNNACTTDNCANGQCVFTPLVCNDNNTGTTDACVNGQCVFTPISCNDNNPCTTDGFSNGQCVYTPVVCNDNNICTSDVCNNGLCQHTPMVCNDNNACTTDNCNGGQCSYTPKNCNDNNSCTTDGCANGVCFNTPLACNDNNACTVDACSHGQCGYAPVVCSDDNSCTDDACISGACVFTETSGSNNLCAGKDCNDNNLCTIDTCINGECVRTPKSCNDYLVCTNDQCANGNCYYFPVANCEVTSCPPLDCEDRNPCTYDFCGKYGGCVNRPINCKDDNPCTDDFCVNGVCEYVNTCDEPCSGNDCNDGNACTIDEYANGQCINSIISCNDGNSCTADVCNNGTCINTPLPCNDNNACTADRCNNGQCSYTPMACSDGNNCTTDNCVGGQCVFTPMNCNDNIACTIDNCNNGVCTHQNNCQVFCTPQDCNDNNPCTTDNCVNGQCVNTPMNCNDNNACTTDNCVNGQCVFTPKNCNDNNACTTDNCVNGQCVFTPKNCNDNNTCTTDNCVNGQCVNSPLSCNDNNPCTADNCASGQCTHTPMNCNDNNPCTTDNCVSGVCTHTNNCPDNCTGVICNDNNPCTNDVCVNGTCNYTIPLCDDNTDCTLDVAIIGGACENTSYELQPAYLTAINTGKSWRKLKIGYDPVNFWNPKQDVTAGGNNMLCITLRTVGQVNWSAIQFRTLSANLVTMGDYIDAEEVCPGVWTKICIPLSDFPAPNFDGMSYLEFPYSFGAEAFEIHILKIEFTGGATPFIWFGDEKTDNVHDGQSGSTSALVGEVVYGDLCNAAAKMAGERMPESAQAHSANLRAYPVPFRNVLQLDVQTTAAGRAKISLMNVVGQIVHQELVESAEGESRYEIQAGAALAPGIYFLHFESEGINETVKIIKAE